MLGKNMCHRESLGPAAKSQRGLMEGELPAPVLKEGDTV